MTEEMAFECLLVSQDASVASIMDKLLGDLSISTKVAPTPEAATEYLSEGSTDLVIVDWQKDSPEFLRHIHQWGRPWKPTVMVVSDIPIPIPEAYPVLRKPITADSGAQSLKQTYLKLLRDHRQNTRHVLMKPLVAQNQHGDEVPIMVENIGEGGVGLSAKEFLSLRDVLSFSLLQPGTEMPIDIEVRVLWVRQYGAAGCEFVKISQDDRRHLRGWIEQKCPVRKPLVKL